MELRTADPRRLTLNPDNPRRTKASAEADAQLAANIKAIGLIQPPRVKEVDGRLEVIAGNRRVKASIAAGLTEIHILVGDADEADPLRSLAENTQRAQMGPVDQWRAIEGLCGASWSEEAIAAAFSMSIRTIRKLRLLARIHPAMLDRMAYDLPREDELRIIAGATLDEQAAAWKRLKPKKGDTVGWHMLRQALEKTRLPIGAAKFDAELATTYGVVWEDDLFGPADQDNRTTANVEEFFAAQHHWLESTLPANGVIVECESWGHPKLPPKAERVYGKAKKTDKVAFGINPRTGEIDQVPFRMAALKTRDGAAAADEADAPARAARPEISSRGVEEIGRMRTMALHQALQEAEISAETLFGLLVMAFGATNVQVHSPGTAGREERVSIARRLIAGGALTTDPVTLHAAAREMLGTVLSCREGMSQSGTVARIAGDTIGADRFLPNMADNEFLKLLSKDGITKVVQAENIAPRNTGKEMRAALIAQIGAGTFVLPAARFALTPDDIEQLDVRIRADAGRSEDDASDTPYNQGAGDLQEEDGTDEGEDEPNLGPIPSGQAIEQHAA